MNNYYEVLGVRPAASVDEIEAAYETCYNHWRRLVTHHDPETVNRANQALRWLEKARVTLTDPAEREAYDASIGLRGSVGGLADPQARPNLAGSRPTPPPRANRPAQVGSGAARRTDAWVCPRCQAANAIGTRFCKKCGNQIGDECAKCGADLEMVAGFCPACGVNQKQARREKEMKEAERVRQEQALARERAEERAIQEAQERRLRKMRITLAVMGIVLGAVAAPVAWEAIWPDVMSDSVLMAGQAIVGAIGGAVASAWAGGSAGMSSNEGAGYAVGFVAGILGGILAFPIIVLGIVTIFLGG